METTKSCCILLDIGPPMLQQVLGPFNYILPIVVVIICDSDPIRLHGLVHSDDRVLTHVKVSGAQCLIFSWSEVLGALIRYNLPLRLRLRCLWMGNGILIPDTLDIKLTIITPSHRSNNIIKTNIRLNVLINMV
jgi:hypothetical protein